MRSEALCNEFLFVSRWVCCFRVGVCVVEPISGRTEVVVPEVRCGGVVDGGYVVEEFWGVFSVGDFGVGFGRVG